MPNETNVLRTLLRALVFGSCYGALSCSAAEAGSKDAQAQGNSPNGNQGTGASHGTGGTAGVNLDVDASVGDAGVMPTEDDNCGLVPYLLDRKPAPVLLAQDRSTSMRGSVNVGTGTRWENVSAAVKQVVATTEAHVHWGLKFFPNEQECQVSVGPEIVPMLSNAAPIIAQLDAILGDAAGTGLTDGTPTRKVLEDATSYLNTVDAGNKYIVLATDGQPTCLNDGTTSDDTAAALEAGRAAAALGIKIAVVGIAFDPVDPGAMPKPQQVFLNDMADIGGMARNDPLDPQTRFYPAENTNQLVDAFTAITGQVVSCTFKLPKQPPVPDNVAVKINGVTVPPDPVNGWEYDAGMTSVTLHGSACAGVTDSPVIDVKIIMGCPGQVIL